MYLLGENKLSRHVSHYEGLSYNPVPVEEAHQRHKRSLDRGEEEVTVTFKVRLTKIITVGMIFWCHDEPNKELMTYLEAKMDTCLLVCKGMTGLKPVVKSLSHLNSATVGYTVTLTVGHTVSYTVTLTVTLTLTLSQSHTHTKPHSQLHKHTRSQSHRQLHLLSDTQSHSHSATQLVTQLP